MRLLEMAAEGERDPARLGEALSTVVMSAL
jgi:hypothetical protein